MFELSVTCPEASVEILGETLFAMGALSVSIDDAHANTEAEQALFGEPGLQPLVQGWSHSRISALFEAEHDARQAADQLVAQSLLARAQVCGVQAVAQQDWVRLTQSQFSPVAVTQDFFIVPSWCETPSAAKHVITLDPGAAFGTGAHPTTRMCLKWLATRAAAGESLGRTLDYGCGSGILAIAAKKFGATAVDAVDIDPAALQTCQDNAQLNHTAINCGPPELVQNHYQTILANILAAPLIVLAPLLCAHVSAGGHLVLAGLLARQCDQVCAAYAPWIALRASDEVEGWAMLSGQKTGAALPLPW